MIAAERNREPTAILVLFLLAASLGCIALAPTLMPDSYSWVEHSISESAAQGVDGAWVARLGLLLFGSSVLVLVATSGQRWGLWARMAHGLYGVSIVGAAVFAHMPWEDVPYDETEDLLHSIASFGVGFGFIAGVVLVTIHRPAGAWVARIFDWVAIGAAVVITMVMFNNAAIAGMVQRLMFAIAYLWYGIEAVRVGWMTPAVEPAAAIPEVSPSRGM